MNKKLHSLIQQFVKEELSLSEKKLKNTETPPAEDTEPDLESSDEEPSPDAPSEPSMDISGGSDTEKRIGQGLQQALDAARDMPDSENKNKLIRQIGNTALFFLKTQIPVDGGQA